MGFSEEVQVLENAQKTQFSQVDEEKEKDGLAIMQMGGSLTLCVTSCSAGRLEIYYSGRWETVCDDRFDQIDADIACQQFGYLRAYISPSPLTLKLVSTPMRFNQGADLS